MLWFENGKKIDKYSGPRSLDDLKAYVEQRTSSEGEAKPSENVELKEDSEGAVLQLTSVSFPQTIEKGITFIKFCKSNWFLFSSWGAHRDFLDAPWCGHCKRLLPTWNQLAEKFFGNESVKIAKVDCTLQENRDLCSEQDVNGFPTLFIYKDGEKISEYNGSRSLDDLFEFVNTHTTASDNARDEL